MIGNALAQSKILQFQSVDEYGNHQATIYLGKNEFLIRSSTSLLKTRNSDKLMEYTTLESNKTLAVMTSFEDYSSYEKLFFLHKKWAKEDTIIHADTIYYKADSIINGYKCKKVGVNYLKTTPYNLNVTKDSLAINIHAIVWIYPGIKLKTPFTFNSKKFNGFIMRYEEHRPPMSDVYVVNFIPLKQADISNWVFQIPASYVLCKSREEYEEKISDEIQIRDAISWPAKIPGN